MLVVVPPFGSVVGGKDVDGHGGRVVVGPGAVVTGVHVGMVVGGIDVDPPIVVEGELVVVGHGGNVVVGGNVPPGGNVVGNRVIVVDPNRLVVVAPGTLVVAPPEPLQPNCCRSPARAWAANGLLLSRAWICRSWEHSRALTSPGSCGPTWATPADGRMAKAAHTKTTARTVRGVRHPPPAASAPPRR